ncbi:hypothetical protein chiPu_0024570, partial [Chiloscyllium punctatum]|nr:hypothetical protein [Chiloscyllium punctatum]
METKGFRVSLAILETFAVFSLSTSTLAVCNFVCHSTCSAEAIICPTPLEQIRSLGIDPVKGTGTAFEGSVSVPKPTGVKKGWHRAHAILCDFKIFVYEVAESRSAQASAAVTHVFDLR